MGNHQTKEPFLNGHVEFAGAQVPDLRPDSHEPPSHKGVNTTCPAHSGGGGGGCCWKKPAMVVTGVV